MKKFLVLFKAPISVLEEWSKTDPEVRKAAEDKMKGEWQAWMSTNAVSIVDIPAGAGKTTEVTSNGATDTKNDVMMYGTVEASTPEDASKMFVGHPHLGIPQASIEIMPVNPIA